MLALAVLLAVSIAGCRASADIAAITALVERLGSVLATADAAARADGLGQIFAGLDGSAAESMAKSLAPNGRELRLAIQRVEFLPLGDARVTISVTADGTTSTMEARAKKVDGAWKLDPSYHVKYRLDEVKAPER